MTEQALQFLLQRFLNRILPAKEWTHEAHLTVALMLGRSLDPGELLPTLRRAIIAHNIASGGQNSDTAGYHETITAFYAATVGAFARASLHLPAGDAAARLLASPLADRRIVLRAYDEQSLKTKTARLSYHPPDKADFSAEELATECLTDAG
jgi:hypothetical protein